MFSKYVLVISISALLFSCSKTTGVSGPAKATATVSTGTHHSCLLIGSGAMNCWGRNSSGQLGSSSAGTDSIVLSPQKVSSLKVLGEEATDGDVVTQVAVGEFHTCVMTRDGAAKCWGQNVMGQLGNGTTSASLSPVDTESFGVALAISSGDNHTCVLISGGSVKCWGYNNFGQLGNGSYTSSSSPVVVTSVDTAIAIAAGGNHTCAILADKTVTCWGANDFGQLGDNSQTTSNVAVAVSNLVAASAVSSGRYHTCVFESGAVQCWGRNSEGQLGTGTASAFSLIPVAVTLESPGSISAGGAHTCVNNTAGAAYCWGANDYGQLGTSNSDLFLATPTAISSLASSVQQIESGADTTCAVTTAGLAKCWGRNDDGQVGDGTTVHRRSPVDITGTD